MVREFLGMYSTPGTSAVFVGGGQTPSAPGTASASPNSCTEGEGAGVPEARSCGPTPFASTGGHAVARGADAPGASSCGGGGGGSPPNASATAAASAAAAAVTPAPEGSPKQAVGYQSYERTAEDVVASTEALCQGYNPDAQGGWPAAQVMRSWWRAA